jgi:hypothetical protein
MFPVSACKKYTSFSGMLLRAPANKVRKISKMEPAVKNKPRKPNDAPIVSVKIWIL